MKIILTKQRQEVQIVPSTECSECMFENMCNDKEHNYTEAFKFEKENGLDECSENGGVKYILLES